MSFENTNPYEPPISDTSSFAESDEPSLLKVSPRVSRPGTWLMIMASVFSVFPAIYLVSSCVMVPSLGIGSIISLSSLAALAHFACSLMISIGGAKMAFMESYSLARLGAVLACVPIISPFFVWGIPFGVWALVVLNDPKVQAGFQERASRLDKRH